MHSGSGFEVAPRIKGMVLEMAQLFLLLISPKKIFWGKFSSYSQLCGKGGKLLLLFYILVGFFFFFQQCKLDLLCLFK